ncbi:hypothetical protein BsWGS_09159 [Bradybaena similaris]
MTSWSTAPRRWLYCLRPRNPGAKDSRWLTLEVCREFQRSKCSRTDLECKFAHPPPHVEIQNGRVVACFDSIKGKCQRKDPPCKYLHPPQHLREQLLQNGRNNLILKNLQIQAYQTQYANIMPMAYETGSKTVTMSAVMPGQYSYLAHPSSSQAPPQAVMRPPTMTPAVAAAVAASPYDAAVSFAASQKTHYPGLQALSTVPAQAPTAAYSPYLTSYASVPMPASGDPTSVMSQAMPANMIAAKAMRADKFEVCREFQRGTCSRPASECRYAHPAEHIVVDATDNHVTVCMDFVKSKCTRDQCKYFHPPSHLQALVRAAHARNQAAVSYNNTNSCSTLQSTVPGMVPAYKRIALGDISKGGYPVYQTNPLMSPLQHTSLMHLQQQPSYIPVSFAGHPPSVPRI